MTLPRPRFTYEEYKRLPDDQRYEVLEGELVMTPSPHAEHQAVSMRLSIRLGSFVLEKGLGMLLAAPFDVILSEHDVLQPDLLFISQERLSILQQHAHGAPDLVVEILSPSTAERDLETKRRIYSQYGVREYWIVDPKAKAIDVLTQQGGGLDTWQRFQGEATLQSPLLTGLAVNLTEIFPA